MDPQKTHHSLTAPEPDIDEKQSMEAVRDLLFGKKMREIGDQIGSLESRLGESMEELERRVGSRVDSLEQFVKGEIGSAKERFEREQVQLEKRAAETGEKFRGLSESLDQRFSQLETHIGRVESDTRGQLLEHSKEMAGEIEESTRRIREMIDREVESLKQNSARKNELGEMLVELGMRLTTTEEAGIEGVIENEDQNEVALETDREEGFGHDAPADYESHEDGLPA